MTGRSPEVVVVATEADVARFAAERIADTLAEAIDARGVAHWSTLGGSTAEPIYRSLLGPAGKPVRWDRVHVWLGDERIVPRADPLSNARLVDETLSDAAGGPLPAANIHAWPTDGAIAEEHGPEWSARFAAYVVRAAGLPLTSDGVPVFDLVTIGMGPDGHVLSVFPGAAPFPDGITAAAVPAPRHVEPHVPRITFTPRIIDAARSVIVVAHGAGKADAVAAAFAPGDELAIPARRAVEAGATWILDEAAAARLAVPRP